MITTTLKDLFNRSRFWGAHNPIGDALFKQKGVIVGKYSFAVQGGAVGSISLLEDLTSPKGFAKLPLNAIVTNAYFDVVTAMTSTGGTGTIELTVQSAGDLKAATDADTFSGRVQGIPDNAVANMIKLTAERTLIVTVATNALLSGKFNLFVEYVISE